MLDPRWLDDVSRRLADLFPQDPDLLKTDLERNIQALLNSAIIRLNLTTREEFEVQSAVLARTRAQLQQLEARIAELERILAKTGE